MRPAVLGARRRPTGEARRGRARPSWGDSSLRSERARGRDSLGGDERRRHDQPDWADERQRHDQPERHYQPDWGDERERGAGLLGTSAGLLVFLLLMFAAVQILFNLYATSMVTSAAYDAARSVAGFDSAASRCAAVPAAERAFADALGDYATAAGVSLTWTCTDPRSVRLRVQADHPSVLPPRMAGLGSLASLDRTITVRTEQPR